jgi:ATP-dependent RNA helicase DeaD
MRDGRARVCVATDVAARGIDLPSLDLVIHADLPTNPDTLLHRSGRTGRAGRKGICILVAPLHRRRSAERLLSLAKVQAATVRAPSQHDIQERDKERMLNSVAGTEGSTDELDTVAELMKRHSAEAIALAYIRMVQASRPNAEELSETHIPDSAAPMASKEAERFDNGVWFRLPQGRKHNVEPRWLIPTLCKAGHLTKRDIGFIRLLDNETRFEVRPEKAESFLEALSTAKGSDKGLRVTKFIGDPTVLPPREKSHDGGERPKAERPKFDRGAKPKPDYAAKREYAPKKDFGDKKDFGAKKDFAPKKDYTPKTEHAPKDFGAIERPQGDWAPKDQSAKAYVPKDHAPKEKKRWSKDQKAARPKPEGAKPFDGKPPKRKAKKSNG